MIGRTLFWYIFKDLMRIFFMASGALAGIMSFGGLLRPLTHQGLDVGQVGKVLSYFMPAMTAYSLPVAALFATTVVYGRLSADNELTACRAGGVSHLSVAAPAFVMGILVAIMSLVFLCFIVPAYTLKVEMVLYSNLAKLIAGKIEQNHHIPFGAVDVFAQEAYLPPPDPRYPGEQLVVLRGPTIETVTRPFKERDYRVPRDFYTASEAVIRIRQQGDFELGPGEKVFLTIQLENGFKFPRQFQGSTQGGVQTTEYGPIDIPSPIKEDTKFMDVWHLKRLYRYPAQAAKIRRLMNEFIQRDQQHTMADFIARDLNGPGKSVFEFEGGERYVLSREATAPYAIPRGPEVIVAAPPPTARVALAAATDFSIVAAALIAPLPPVPALALEPGEADIGERPITFRREAEGQVSEWKAREAHLRVHHSGEPGRMHLSLELLDAVSRAGSETVVRKNFIQPFDVPMGPRVDVIAGRSVSYYAGVIAAAGDQQRINRELLVLRNDILAESHSRVSFAISCLILVLVGCALGMMFRSGNFLSAFAVSFVPALVTITLIVAGQRISGNVPDDLADVAHYANTPLQMGLALVWAGNTVNFVLATSLLWRLQKK